MSSQVLARKWRPKHFKQMVGQEHALRMLSNALEHKRLHHAYLFTGTRGVGKTTLARILAKCLNCESGICVNPCDQCNICQAIDTGRFLDLIEIDAASRTKVEDTREILDNVQYAPSQGRYKIYLIDEVHMLSGHSFNALLKTLEEPPAHVKFLLATTDPKRLPITILSRCLQFNLKRVPIEQMADQLEYICQAETITFERSALDLIAKAADGSMRDALSLLDQAIAFCENKVSLVETRLMLGSIEQDAIFRLLHAVVAKDGTTLLNEIAHLAEHAPDFSQVADDLMHILHQISITQVIPNAPNSSETMTQLANLLQPEQTQLYYQIALIGRRDLALASTPAQGFEMMMLRMLAFTPTDNHFTPDPTNKKTSISKTPTTSAASQPTKLSPHSIDSTQPALTTTTPAPDLTQMQNWTSLLPQLRLTGMAQALAVHCTLEQVNENQIVLALTKKHETLLNKKLHERIEQTLSTYFKKPIKLEFKITTDDIETPAKLEQEQKATQHANATEAIKNDPTLKKVLDVFGGTIDMGSVKAVTQN